MITLAAIRLFLKGALPFLRRNWKAFAILLICALALVVSCRRENAAYDRGYAASSEVCESARLAAEDAVREAQERAREAGRIAGIEEGKRLTESQVEIRTVTRDVVRRIEVPLERIVTVTECPLNETALEEIRSNLNEQRRRLQ